jgi:NAD(P)-dependent dehydrogenase (short-subunit alcohol dehydrogenase family)
MKPETPGQFLHAPGKLSGKVALINDRSTPIGLAIADLFAQEGADIAFSCPQDSKISETAARRESKSRLLMSGDSTDVSYCIDAVERTLFAYGGIDILVNSMVPSNADMSSSLTSALFMTHSALFYMAAGGNIVNTIPMTSENSRVSDCLAAKVALTNFTQVLAKELVFKQIRVNGIGLGPAPQEPAQDDPSPEEIAPSYLYLASGDSSQMTGQVLYPKSC